MRFFSEYISRNGGSVKAAGKNLADSLVRSDFVHDVAGTFAARILLACIGVLTTIIVARVLGPEGRGLYAVAGTIGALGVQFGNLGLHASNTYTVARNREVLPVLLSNTLLIGLGFGSFGAVVIWFLFSLWPGLAPVQGLLLLLGLAWIPFGLTYMLLQNLLLGLQLGRAYNLTELFFQALGLGLLGLLTLLQAVSVASFFSAGLIALIIGGFCVLLQLLRQIGHLPRPSVTLFRQNLHYGIKAYAAGFFAFLVLRVDLLMVQYMLGAVHAGYYSIAVNMADMVVILPTIAGMLLFPRLSAMQSEQQKWEVTRRVAFSVGMVMFCLTGAAALLSGQIVLVLFGELFALSVPAFVWLMPGLCILSVNMVLMNYFASSGMPLVTVYSPAIAAVLNVALNFYLIPEFGIAGASISSTLCYGLMFVASILYIAHQRKTGM